MTNKNKYLKYLVLGLIVTVIFMLNDNGFFDKYLKSEQPQKSTHKTMDIYQCAQMGNFDCVKKKVESGADINALSHKGVMVLQAAAVGGNTDIVKYLIEQGADINAKDKGGQIVLNYATYGNHPDIAKILIEAGVDINAKGTGGATALHGSIAKGNLEITKALLYAGADMNLRDANNNTPACYIHQSNNTEILKLMLNYGLNLNSKCAGYTVANAISLKGNEDMQTILQQKGYNITARQPSPRDTSRITVAKREEYLRDEFELNSLKASPVHIAVAKNEINTIKSLIQQGSNVNGTNKIGDTPLHYATEYFHIETFISDKLQAVEASGGDIQSINYYSMYTGIVREKLEIVKILINAGTSVNAKNRYKETALHNVANLKGYEDPNKIKELFAQHGSMTNPSLPPEIKAQMDAFITGAEANNIELAEANKIIIEMAKLLMEAGVDINAKDFNGMDAIRVATMKYNTPLIEEIQKYKK